MIDQRNAITVLSVAGTSEHYRGLFESASSVHPLDKALLDHLEAGFPATARLPAMAEAMVEVEHAYDHLKSLEQGDWKLLPTQPDLLPEHEALLLREHFTELLRTDEVKRQSEKFRQLLKDGEAGAEELEFGLRSWRTSAPESATPEAVKNSFRRVGNNCKSCHEQFRDVPLSQKGSR